MGETKAPFSGHTPATMGPKMNFKLLHTFLLFGNDRSSKWPYSQRKIFSN